MIKRIIKILKVLIKRFQEWNNTNTFDKGIKFSKYSKKRFIDPKYLKRKYQSPSGYYTKVPSH